MKILADGRITEAQKQELHRELTQYYQRYGLVPPGMVHPDTPAPPAVHVTAGWRCGDSDRDACLARLREALAQGYLSHEEFGARQDAVLAELTRTGLTQLTADLPPARTPEPAQAGVLGFFPPAMYLAWMLTTAGIAVFSGSYQRWVFAGLTVMYAAALALSVRKRHSG